jgi:UPF0716 protein FxsA
VRFFLIPFVLLPLLELFVLIQVGAQIGAVLTIGLVLFTSALGLALLRQQGYSTLMRAREKAAQGQIPAEEMLGGVFVALGGLLLLFPGFITDVIGLCCLVPPLRRFFLKGLLSRWLVVGGMSVHARRGDTGRVIDGEFERDDKHDRLP